jgi:hypothetical protein
MLDEVADLMPEGLLARYRRAAYLLSRPTRMVRERSRLTPARNLNSAMAFAKRISVNRTRGQSVRAD